MLDSEWAQSGTTERRMGGPAFKGTSVCQAFSGRLVADDSHVCIIRVRSIGDEKGLAVMVCRQIRRTRILVEAGSEDSGRLMSDADHFCLCNNTE